ncbi:MAG: transposase [Dehalococcoidia bacterium]|nr:transposase [Dehalococcoidia bacterium]
MRRKAIFRKRDPQESLFQSNMLVPPAKAQRLQRSWAEVFRNRALPLIDEERFADMYCEDNGRPNRAVQTVLGVHILKEMSNLTDEEALEELEFNLLWHHALRLDIEETHLPQKTLHNFRGRLMPHDGGRVAFQETTDQIITALGIRTGKQRLDSTHIMSNIAILTRLGLFCETMRYFFGALRRDLPHLMEAVPTALVRRYLKEEGEPTSYEDARSGDGRRRLSVCARDLYRLVDRFRGTAAAGLEEYRLLERLLREQCLVGRDSDGRPGDDDDDAGETKVPIALKDPKEVPSDSLQSPYDPEATYSGHKGKGYEAQVAETCDEENICQIITLVEVTPSSGSDTDVTVPAIESLAERNARPDELFADTSYGSGRNAFEAELRGTELVSPVAGPTPAEKEGGEGEEPRLTPADFQIDVTGGQPTVCPAGNQSIEEYKRQDAPERVEIHFARSVCETCSLRSRCPVKLNQHTGDYVLKADLVKVKIDRRRIAEANEEWHKRYAIRAGIEGTNSELKRRHGFGRLRVRGGRRVQLAVYLKALACNVKRMVRALQMQESQAGRSKQALVAVPA